MVSWYNKIISDPDNYQHIFEAINYFESEYEQAKSEVLFKNSIEKASASLPGVVEYRFSQLQEIEAILEHLNIKYKKLRASKFNYYQQNYGRKLSSSDAKLYAEGDDDILALSEVINNVSFIRNKYLGITKGLETKSYQINNVIKLRQAGIEDASLDDVYIPDANSTKDY